MTKKTFSILLDPHPKCHIVYPYADSTHIAEAVSAFAAAGLDRNEAVVLITTRDKRDAIEHDLREGGIDLEGYIAAGRLVFFDAEGLLCNVLTDSKPHAELFKKVIGEIIEAARQKSPSGKVRAYGEMVNLLCGHNDLESAALLEEWWNGLIQAHNIALFCSYSLELLQPHEASGLPQRLLDLHTHVVAA